MDIPPSKPSSNPSSSDSATKTGSSGSKKKSRGKGRKGSREVSTSSPPKKSSSDSSIGSPTSSPGDSPPIAHRHKEPLTELSTGTRKSSTSRSPKKTPSGSSISSHGSSPGDPPSSIRRSREHYLELQEVKVFVPPSPDKLISHWDGIIQTCETLLKKEKLTLETAYAMTVCHCQLFQLKKARPFAEALMELAPPGHPKHPLACLWMGITLYRSSGHYDERIMSLLKVAHDARIPLAAKYMMDAYSGINNSLSEVKWTDPVAYLKVARTLKQQQNRHFEYLRHSIPGDPSTRPIKQQMYLDLRIQTEVKGFSLNERIMFEFNLLISELIVAPDDGIDALCQKIEAKIEKHDSEEFPSNTLPILYLYALGSRDSTNAEVIDELAKKKHCMAGFCVSELLKPHAAYPTQERFDLLTSARELIQAYRYQAEMLSSLQAFSQAKRDIPTGN